MKHTMKCCLKHWRLMLQSRPAANHQLKKNNVDLQRLFKVCCWLVNSKQPVVVRLFGNWWVSADWYYANEIKLFQAIGLGVCATSVKLQRKWASRQLSSNGRWHAFCAWANMQCYMKKWINMQNYMFFQNMFKINALINDVVGIIKRLF